MEDCTAKIEAQFETLKAHVETLPESTIKDFERRANEDAQSLIDWTNEGHAVAVYIATHANPEALSHADEMGQTALHHASRDQSGLLSRILTDQPNGAVFKKDRLDQTPLDCAGARQNENAQSVLLPLTYAHLFQQPELKAEMNDTQEAHINNYADMFRSMQTQSLEPDKERQR